jgi:hypothetical protein
MSPDEKQKVIELEGVKFSIKAMHIHMSANAEIQARILKDIEKTANQTLEQTKRTNGRVTILEEEMVILEEEVAVITFLKKKKWLMILLLFGFLKIYELVDINYLWTKLLTLL